MVKSCAFYAGIFLLIMAAGCISSVTLSHEEAEAGRTEEIMKSFPIHTGMLDNGLRYVISGSGTGDVVSVVAVVKAGSIYEDHHLGAGLSHFCEHIVHEGTTSSRTGGEYTELVERLGNNSNAYTSRDHTCYYITTTRDRWEQAIDCISEWLFDCQFSEEEYRREKGVILREIEKSESEPWRILSQCHSETMFRDHPVRHPVLGYRGIFETVTRDELYSYYKRMYIPGNTVISVSGPVHISGAEQKLRKVFETVPPSRGSGYILAEEPRQLGERRRTVAGSIRGGYVRMGFHTVSLDHPDLFALDVLSGILSGGETGRVTYTLREEKAIAVSVGTYSYTPIYDAGVFGIWAEADPKDLSLIEKEVWDILRDIKKRGVTGDEMKRVRKQIESSAMRDLKTAEDRAMSFARNYLWTSNPLFDVYYIDNIKKVTAEQVRDVCTTYLKRENLTVTSLVPQEAAASGTEDRIHAPEEKTSKRVLDNDITVLTKRCGMLPLVNIDIAMRAGSRVETRETAGISNLFAKMLLRGSKKFSRDAILEFFDSTGARISASSGRNTVRITAEILSEDTGPALDILGDIISYPLFSEEALSKVRQLTIQELTTEDDHWRTRLANRFRDTFYTRHPYGNNPKGTVETVGKLRSEHLRDYYAMHTVGRNMVIGVYGDIPPDIFSMVEKSFSSIRSSDYAPPDVPPEPPRQRSVKKVYPGSSPHIAGIYVGYPGISYLDTKAAAVFDVIDAMTSGIGYPGGWLHSKLRGERLVYVVHAFNVSGIDPGHFGIYAGCDPSNIEKALHVIQNEIGRLEKGDFSDKEVTEAKKLCVLSEKLSYETPAQIAMRENLDTLYGLGHDFHETYEQRISSVTRENIIETAKKYFKHRLTVVTAPDTDKGRK